MASSRKIAKRGTHAAQTVPTGNRRKSGVRASGRNQSTARSNRTGHAQAIDEQLARYQSMRDFSQMTEPRGSSRSTSKRRNNTNLPFVIQKHAASHLHYDFRLGWRGVLKSWAVTKGPSYVPSDKRLAVQVEDHPMEYGGFEGIIPKGQYGGGTVMLWDQGTWEPIGDAEEGFRKGNLKFTLRGKKLQGGWALIRMGSKAAEEKKPNWLLIKERDGKEHSPDDPPITEAMPNSVVTGRNLDEIAENRDHVWEPTGSQKGVDESDTPARRQANRETNGPDISKAPKEALPKFISPQLALAAKEPPEGTEWLHELKLDGYRMQARIDHRSGRSSSSPVVLITRGGLDWTHHMLGIARVLGDLPVQQALLDGEVVVFDRQGRSSFARLQDSIQEDGNQPLVYVVFDLLHLDGHNLRGLPVENRKAILEELLNELPDHETIRFGEHLRGSGKEIFEGACELGAEGIVSKRASSAYVSARNGSWLKIKCIRGQEFVIGGFTRPSKEGVGFGALLLGYYRDGTLIYAGRTGTGYTQKMRREIGKQLDKLTRSQSPFKSLPSGAARDAVWVEPKLVCEVNFATWTADRLVRQASFKGLREDKPAKSVELEVPVDAGRAQHRSGRLRNIVAKENRSGNNTALNDQGGKQPIRSKAASSDKTFPIVLTHPDRVVDSETQLTKRELADYFWAIREHMLPFIVERPLSVVRCPRGSTEPCFFQKHVTGKLPDGVEGIEIRERGSEKTATYLMLSNALGLAGFAQMGVLELHPWGSSNRDIEKPDILVFDLDPDPSISWRTLADGARELQSRLRRYKLQSFLKSTGGKGLHVVAPIQPEQGWPIVKEFARMVATQMESENPRVYVTNMAKAARTGKMFIDYLRNDRGATSVAPYSPRARAGAPVAIPLAWNELDGAQVPRFLVGEFTNWKERLRRNPWKKFFTTRQSLTGDVVAQIRAQGAPGQRSRSRSSESSGKS